MFSYCSTLVHIKSLNITRKCVCMSNSCYLCWFNQSLTNVFEMVKLVYHM